jgi:hypothetical protein
MLLSNHEAQNKDGRNAPIVVFPLTPSEEVALRPIGVIH